MMNLEQVAKRIELPNSIEQIEISELNALTEKYPYAQVFSILYLKSLALHKDIRFEESLQKHAYRITDRMKLHDLIHSDSSLQEQISEEIEIKELAIELVENHAIEVEQSVPIEDIKEAILEEKVADVIEVIEASIEIEEIVSKQNNQESIAEQNAEPAIASVQTTEEVIEDLENVIQLQEQFSPKTGEKNTEQSLTLEPLSEENESKEMPVDEVISLTEVAVVSDVEEIDGVITEETENETEVSTNTESVNLSSELFGSHSDIAEETAEEEAELDELEISILSEIISSVFDTSLKQVEEKEIKEKSENEEGKPEEKEEIIPVEEKKSTVHNFSDWLTLAAPSEETIPSEKEEIQPVKIEKEKINSIVDQFIKEEPRISRPVKEFYSPSKKAKESLDGSALIYTETLADIFALQGNFPKAIAAYEQLMLTIPEKKSYFALRIKEFKDKLNK